MKLATINSLMYALDVLKQNKGYERFKIELSTEDLEVLVSRIYDYTLRLAENNQIELTAQEKFKTDSPILNLQNYLKAQKRIFEEVA